MGGYLEPFRPMNNNNNNNNNNFGPCIGISWLFQTLFWAILIFGGN